MSFTHSAFIRKNTPELRKKLEELGWRAKYVQECSDTIVTASNTGAFSAIVRSDQKWFEDYKNECIDCSDNEPLFLAIAALRDDSDYMQFFTDGVGWWQFTHKDAVEILGHKATLNELIEHFKQIEK